MSTHYRCLKDILASDLFGGRLGRFGVHKHPDSTETDQGLTDGRNAVAVDVDDKGLVTGFTRRHANAPQKIFHAIEEAFGTEIVSEVLGI